MLQHKVVGGRRGAARDSPQKQAALLPELGAEQAVDENVDGGVEHEQKVADADQDERPQGEALLLRLGAPDGRADGEEFMNIEQKSGKVAHQKDQHKAHEDGRQVVLEPPASFVDGVHLPPSEPGRVCVKEQGGRRWRRRSPRRAQPALEVAITTFRYFRFLLVL